MKILLTGAAGFLGSHISKKLIDNDYEVIGLDDLSTGSIKNIEQLVNNPRYTFIEHDVRIPYQAKVDAILNFACPASPVNYQKDPIVFELCAEHGYNMTGRDHIIAYDTKREV